MLMCNTMIPVCIHSFSVYVPLCLCALSRKVYLCL